MLVVLSVNANNVDSLRVDKLPVDTVSHIVISDTVRISDTVSNSDAIVNIDVSTGKDSLVVLNSKKIKKVEYWQPDPQRAMWYSMLCPGLGQIYNRSYWKVPLIYGIGVACVYVVSFQGRMYNEYSNAYYSIMDNDPYTNDYMPIFDGLDGVTRDWQVATLKKKMDTYRRYRDLCIFGTVILYVGNVLDAFVDAHLYDFSISDDLSLRVVPDIKFNPSNIESGSFANNASLGLKFALRY